MSDSSGHIHSDIRRHGIRVARLVQGDGLTKLPYRSSRDPERDTD
jgi:hypothetical protein